MIRIEEDDLRERIDEMFERAEANGVVVITGGTEPFVMPPVDPKIRP